MRQTASPLESVELFEGIVSAELKAMLQCLGAQTKEMKRGAIILLAGDKPQYMGIVLDGQLHVVKEDYDGNRLLLAAITPGELFAEALCCAGVPESPVTVMAERDSSVMLLAFTRILRTCPNACARHAKLIENMLKIIASKNLHLQNRLETISIKSVRAKVLRYLESFISKQGRHITIPFNRRELADFLCVERSALSHELARMRQDGLIDYKKNRFLFKA
ncbi:MAG: Crp/Fnr family transcriptional regulator [Clostridia bacterium]|nr:Crp/Fnr family transcriptional regulator [Clostridia bacterium]